MPNCSGDAIIETERVQKCDDINALDEIMRVINVEESY